MVTFSTIICCAFSLFAALSTLVQSESVHAESTKYDKLLRKFEEFQSIMDQQNIKITQLEFKNKIYSRDISVLKEKDTKQEEEILIMKRKEEIYVKQLVSVQEICQKLEQKQNASYIGYTAYATHELEIYQNNPVIFNNVITNSGDFFNTQSGIFEVPLTGFYFFILSTQSVAGFSANISIMKNSQIMLRTAVDPAAVDGRKGSTNSVVLPCEAGDNVWLEAQVDGKIHSTNEGRHTSFTGVLLRI